VIFIGIFTWRFPSIDYYAECLNQVPIHLRFSWREKNEIYSWRYSSMKNARILPPKFLAAMIAVLPLPGSPLYDGDDPKIIYQALADLEVYKKAGVDSIVFENDHDLPYIQPPLDEKGVALMTKIVKEARRSFDGPLGIQMLEAANITSLEIAAGADLDYIRAEAFVFAHVGGSGIINGSAGKIDRKSVV
jgi:predicted TIM-barrel enzyme